jgi:hypothetical protein
MSNKPDFSLVDEEMYALVLTIESAVDKEQLLMIRELLATEQPAATSPGVTNIIGCQYCGVLLGATAVCSKSPDGQHTFVELPF